MDSGKTSQKTVSPQPGLNRHGNASILLVGLVGSFVGAVFLFYLAIAPHRNGNPDTVRVYCASGLKKPIERLITEFNRLHNSHLEIVRTGGSGELAGQIKTERIAGVDQGADVYITADDQLLEKLKLQEIISRTFPLARQTPVIAVSSQSELNIVDLADLVNNPKIRFGIASERAAIGKLTREIAKDGQYLKLLEQRKSTDSENVMVLAQALVAGSLDAAVIWDTTVAQINAEQQQTESLLKIAAWAGANDAYQGNIAIGIVGTSEMKQTCDAFGKFLRSSEISKNTFAEFGYSFIE